MRQSEETKAWEIVSLANLALGQEVGHIAHSAYHLGRFSELLKRVRLSGIRVPALADCLANTHATRGQANLVAENVHSQATSCRTVDRINLLSSDGWHCALNSYRQTGP